MVILWRCIFDQRVKVDLVLQLFVKQVSRLHMHFVFNRTIALPIQ